MRAPGMLNRDDIIDIILEMLGPSAADAPAASRTAPAPARPAAARSADPHRGPRGRLFLSEYDIRKRLTLNPAELRIPKDAIVSPLATDWLALRRIKIVRE